MRNSILKKCVSFALALMMAYQISSYYKTDMNIIASENESAVQLGDLNGDGTINIFDLIRLKSFYLENDTGDLQNGAADVDGDGKVTSIDVIELAMYIKKQTGSFSSEMGIDTDKDGLCDYVEKEITFTDYNKADTDDDGLSDYDEVYQCSTDPQKPDTDNNGVSDSLEDYDSDGLTNAEEIKVGTSPKLVDTDDDGLSDYEEVNEYKTDPVSVNNKSNILKDQNVDSDSPALKEINNDNKYNLSVSTVSSGKADEKLTVSNSVFSGYILNGEAKNAVTGKIIDVSYDKNETLDQIKIMFNVNDQNAGDYAVFKFYDDINSLLPVCTYYSDDNKTAYITENEPGTYALVNISKWYNAFLDRTDKQSGLQEVNKYFNPVALNNVKAESEASNEKKHFLFMVDLCFSTNSMDIADEILQLSESLFSEYGDDVLIDICCFSYTPDNLMVTPCNNLCSMDEVSLVLDTLKMYFGVNSNLMMIKSPMETPLNVAYNSYKEYEFGYNYVFTFAPNRYSENIYSDDLFTDLRSITNFHASYIVPSESSTNIMDYVKNYTQRYSGQIFYSNEHLDEELFDFINDSLSPKSDLPPDFWNRYYNEIIKKGWFDSTEENIPDSDNDGMNDACEINPVCIKSYDSSDVAIFKTYDEISNGEDKAASEGSEWMKDKLESSGFSYVSLYESKMILFKSYPDISDSDGDGISDAFDPKPAMSMDSCFELAGETGNDIFSLMNTNYINTMEDPETGLNATYNTVFPGPKEYVLLVAVQNGGCMVSSIPGSPNLFKLVTKGDFSYKVTKDTMPVAADNLLAFSLNKYNIKNIPLFDTAIGGTRIQRNKYYKHMNMLMSCSENVLTPGNAMKIKSKKDTSAFSINYDFYGSSANYPYFNSAELDWLIAIGGGQNAVVSDIECYEENGQTYYKAKVEYYLLDVYDWQDSAEAFLYNLHRCGLCKSYYDHALFENTITWAKGARYPEYKSDMDVDLDNTEFSEITDDGLKNACKHTKEIYRFG